MTKQNLILTIGIIIILIFIVIGIIATKNMLEDYKCNNTPINEVDFNKCMKYWKDE